MSRVARKKPNGVTTQLGVLIRNALVDGAGLSDKEADRLAKHIIEHGARNGVAGDKYYWPVRYRGMTPSDRDESITADFDGTNLQDVCKRYGVSRMTVYRAVHQNHPQHQSQESIES